MDKNAIRKYAVWARRELIERVSQRAMIYGITAKEAGDPNAKAVNGRVLSPVERRQRQALIRNIREKGYEQVMEEVAYTWFNRFAALRFMEVNGYLPSHVRVFTNDAGEFKPQILAEAIHLELDGLDMDKVYALESVNRTEELFKYLLIVQCNALNSILPGLFQPIEDYTELLLPDNLLREGSVIEQMVTTIPAEDWTDQVQIIGWLYQYYNTEPKDKVFADLKKNIKITKENIPAATQLFTPDWIVRYMVENSLGRVVIGNLKYDIWAEEEKQKIDRFKAKWKYYLDDAEQEPEVTTELRILEHNKYASGLEQAFVDTTFIDPCMGSGHILVYAFDVFMDIYTAQGWSQRDAARRIVEKNLYGLDIDDRAAQLAYFSVMMKARQYDRRFFSRKVQPHVYATTGFSEGEEYGSLLITENPGEMFEKDGQLSFYDNEWYVRKLLSQKYDVVVTNPPYMAVSNASAKLQGYVKKNFPDAKADLFAVFIERCRMLTKANGYQAMITQHAWMFLSSFEKLRVKLQTIDTVNMAHLGARAFEEIGGEVVQTTSFVLRQSYIKDYLGMYCRLIEPTAQQGKEDMFLAGENRYVVTLEDFSAIPGLIRAYWVSPKIIAMFSKCKPLSEFGITRKGLSTSDNNRFVRLWHEVLFCRIRFGCLSPKETYTKKYKWYPYIHGGVYRKWTAPVDSVVNFINDAQEIKETVLRKYPYLSSPDFVVKKTDIYFKAGIIWNDLASVFNAKYMSNGYIYSDVTPSYIPYTHSEYVLGYFNSVVFSTVAQIVSQGLHYSTGHIPCIPYKPVNEEICAKVKTLVDFNIEICRADWDSFETSWDFQCHPFVRLSKKTTYKANGIPSYRIEDAFYWWGNECETRFQTLKSNEEELNRIFIDIYGLQEELTPEVEDKDVTVRRADLGRDIRSLISYAVGCMFGRYSLDTPGLAYAGGAWDDGKYASFLPDPDNVIPICDDEYFDDDITGRFVKWVEVVFGEKTLEENLKFIADALGGKGTPREVIRSYFLNNFYADHLKTYQKRPIYWLFDSGRKNGFKCLIYMHRYQPDTIARIRTDYVHEQQSRYRTAIADLEQRINGASTSERVKLNKQLQKLQAQAEELRVYEEKIHHLADQMIRIDLDDGVKHNYELFKDVLAKLK